MRRALFALAILVLAWAAVVVPMPLATIAPVEARPVAAVIEVEDGVGDQLSEDLLFTAVRVEQPTVLGAVEVLLDEQRDLTPIQRVVPPGVEPEPFAELQERLFRESVRAAAAVGLRAAGRDVTVTGAGARVVSTVPGTPAADVLAQEDVITAVDGEDVELASELAAVVSGREAGDELELTFRREGESRTETIELATLSELGTPGIGVLVATVDLRIDLPVEVSPTAAARVGGSSAGLMIALTMYDAASEEPLVEGRRVAGTGTMDLSGRIGPVSGVEEKVRGAVLAGAEVFLVPSVHEQEARRAAPDDLEVLVVDTLEEAIAALSER